MFVKYTCKKNTQVRKTQMSKITHMQVKYTYVIKIHICK